MRANASVYRTLWSLIWRSRCQLSRTPPPPLHRRATSPHCKQVDPPQCRQLPAQPHVTSRLTSTLPHWQREPVDPTIYALSTAPGRAAIAVIRISGPACLQIYQSLCPGRKVPKARHAVVRVLYEPGLPVGLAVQSVLDSSALVLYFPAPRTVTGEDVLELHVHGGPAVVKAVLAAIPQCAANGSVRYAEPGEFTRRAFMNDRLDLTQVEALGDTLAATTEQQRRLSIRGTTSHLAKRYEQWRRQLLYARGELEALIDFSEDQHFDESPARLCESVAQQVRVLKGMLQAHSTNALKGELLRNGISISLLGAPNAGKSSLLNRIVGREAAIVSPETGTTRDVVEIGIDLGGYLCRLGDTAGLRTAPNLLDRSLNGGDAVEHQPIGLVEREGMRRAKERAQESDVVIVVLDFVEDQHGEIALRLDPEIIATAAELVSLNGNMVVAVNKSDRLPSNWDYERTTAQITERLPTLKPSRIHYISCRGTSSSQLQVVEVDPGGIQSFLGGLTSYFHELTKAVVPATGTYTSASAPDPSIWQESLGATERHRLLLNSCVRHLDEFLQEVEAGGEAEEADIVVAAESLRGAADCLAKITGKGAAGDVEEVLGVVFEKFCVGK